MLLNELIFIPLFILVSEVEADLETKKVYATSDKPPEELLEALKKTGKAITYVGTE